MKRPPAFLARRIAALGARVRSATPRERTLLAALSAVGVLLLLSLGLRWTRTGVEERRALLVRTEEADRLLQNDPAVSGALDAKIADMAGKNRSAADILAAVDTLARESGLNAEVANPRSDRSGKLTLHRVKLTLRAPTLQKLMDFDDRLRLQGDGLVVERVTVESRSNGIELNAIYEIAACQPAG